MKKEKDKQQKQEKVKPSKKEQILDWLKFLALVLIILPPCTFIFEGFNPYGLIFVGVGILPEIRSGTQTRSEKPEPKSEPK